MDRSIPLLLIGLLFGGGIGFAIAASSGVMLDGHDHGNPAHHGGKAPAARHDHATPLALPDDSAAPTLALDLRRDPASGWNLHLLTANFAFAPDHASGGHVPGEGHAHVYLDDAKLGRVYGPWLHLDNLPPGRVKVRVTLNANDHRPLSVAGQPVAQTVVIEN